MENHDTTIIICCAGMGTRLGIGSTKALVDICGEPLIVRQLELFKDYDDVRIVVGYQAQQVIEVVNKVRKDIMFAFNYDYERTNAGASLTKALLGARKNIVEIDGDVIPNPDDFREFLGTEDECIGGTEFITDEPVYINLNAERKAISFSKTGIIQWPGILKIQKDHLIPNDNHIYDMLKQILPLNVHMMRTREIDTPDDYERAIRWFENGCAE